MADFLIDNQATPTTPASGRLILYSHSGTKLATTRDDAGRHNSLTGFLVNYNTGDVVASAADTYITGSNIAIPTGLTMQVGTTFRWVFGVTKSAAGVAAPTFNVRVGTAATTADTSRLLFTGPAQTAALDAGLIEIIAILRNVGAAGILAGICSIQHNGNTAGLANVPVPTMQTTSAGFDTTVAGTNVGVSVNPGAAGVWTFQVVSAEAVGI